MAGPVQQARHHPVQRMWAGYAPGMGILEHVGRKSGKPYRTPLNVFPTDDGWPYCSPMDPTGTG